MTDKAVLPGVNPDYKHQPFPHMPSSKKDGKPYRDDAGNIVVLHSEDEEKAFRADHDDVADRVPAPPAPVPVDELLAQLEALRADNASLTGANSELTEENARLRAELDAANGGGKKKS